MCPGISREQLDTRTTCWQLRTSGSSEFCLKHDILEELPLADGDGNVGRCQEKKQASAARAWRDSFRHEGRGLVRMDRGEDSGGTEWDDLRVSQ